MPSQLPLPPPALPPRPRQRHARPRAATLCFWGVLGLWIAGIGFIWLLAYTRNSGQWEPTSNAGGKLLLGLLLLCFAVAVGIGIVCRRGNHSR